MVYPNDIVTEASKYLLGRGITILQGNRLGDTEEEHVARLASYMDLNGEREVADMGCGFGAVSWYLHSKAIPNAHFWLINKNRFQLGHCPLGKAFTRRLEDMCSTSIPAGVVGLVMFNYSLCHVDPRAALTEAARIARPGANLFVYDYQRLRGNNALTEKVLAAHFLMDPTFRMHAEVTGWRDVETVSPGGDDKLFREAVNDDALYNEMFDDLQPVIWRAHR